MLDLDLVFDDDRKPVTATAQLVPVAAAWARRAAGLLATVDDTNRRAALRELFEHRAGVCEFDGCLPRDDAERIAFAGLRDAMKKAGELA